MKGQELLIRFNGDLNLGTPFNVTDAGQIKSYLYTIVKNDSLNYLTRQKRIEADTDAVQQSSTEPEAAPIEHLIRAETISILHQAI